MKVVKTELLINVTTQETRVALLENVVLQEIHLERLDTKGIVGNIYMGKVVRILPGMQAAFIDICMERTGFLHVSDILPMLDSGEMICLNAPEADIRQWLHDGQMVMVQAIEDPLGSKEARLTRHLSIASRYLVHMPDLDHVAVSLHLEDEQERQRLHTLVTDEPNQQAHYIIRTVPHGAPKQALQQDLGFLQKLWDKVQELRKGVKQSTCIYQDLALVERAFRDMVNVDIEAVHTVAYEILRDLQREANTYPQAQGFVLLINPDLVEWMMEEASGALSELEEKIKRPIQSKATVGYERDQYDIMLL